MTLEIKSGKEVDPMEDGMFPVCFVGYDAIEEIDYWIVSGSEAECMSASELAKFILGMSDEIENLKKQLVEEKARTNMLNFGQVSK
jgi:hypothetical protein